MEQLRRRTTQRGPRGLIGLFRQLRRADRQHSGELDYYELQGAFRALRYEISEPELQILFGYLDPEATGLADYFQLIGELRGKMNPLRRRLVGEIFSKLDTNGIGEVDIDIITKHFNPAGHPEVRSGMRSAQDVLGEFMETFE